MNKDYKCNVQIVNKSKKLKLFEKYKDRIESSIKATMDAGFDFSINLLVLIVDPFKNENFVNKEVPCGFSTKEGKRYIVGITTESLERIKYDNGLDLEISLYHELGHVYDLYHTLNNKGVKFNPLLSKPKTMRNYVMALGWSFWTEFFAYYFTFKRFYDLHDYPTYFQLVKGYESLEKEYILIEPFISEEQKVSAEKIDVFLENVKAFQYAIAKHLAGCVMGKARRYNYCERTREKKSFKKIELLCDGLYKRIIPLFTNTYGKAMAKKLVKIGDFIIRKLYLDFYICPCHYDGYVTEAIFPKDEE